LQDARVTQANGAPAEVLLLLGANQDQPDAIAEQPDE
jgi:hypothetical protein